MNCPAVSILLPVRNEARFLPAALSSLLRQSFNDWELVAIDDGSTDRTGRLLDELATRDRRVRVWHRPPGGLVNALNFGLRRCRGDYVARMDGDDICHPDRLQRQKAALDRQPEIDLVSCRVRHFPRAQLSDGMLDYERWQNQHLRHEDMLRDLFVESPFVHPSVLFRRLRIIQLGGYRDRPWAEDYDLWLRMALAGCRFSRLPDTLVYWRDRPERVTRTAEQCTAEAFRSCKAHFLKQTFLHEQGEVTLWGAGIEGKAWRKALSMIGIRVCRWLEVDPRKLGQMIHQAPVETPDAFPAGGGKILVTVGSRGARRQIRSRCRQLELAEGVDYLCVT